MSEQTRHAHWCGLLNRIVGFAVEEEWRDDVLYYQCTRCGREVDWTHAVSTVDEFSGRDKED